MTTPDDMRKRVEERLADLNGKESGVLREMYLLPFAAWRLIKGLAKLCVWLALAVFCVWVPWQAIKLAWAGLNIFKGWLI